MKMRIVPLAALGTLCACTTITAEKITPGQEKGRLAYCLVTPRVLATDRTAMVFDVRDDELRKSAREYISKKATFATTGGDIGPPPDFTSAARIISTRQVSVVNEPSQDNYYAVDVKGGPFTTLTFDMKTGKDGCLAAFSATGNDQTASAISTFGSLLLVFAAGAGADYPIVTLENPSAELFLLQQASGDSLRAASERIAELSLIPANERTEKQDNDLRELTDKVAKLVVALNPQPSRVSDFVSKKIDVFGGQEDNLDDLVIQKVMSMVEGGEVSGGLKNGVLVVAKRMEGAS